MLKLKQKFFAFEEQLKCVKIENLNYDHLMCFDKNVKLNQMNFIETFLKYYTINEIDKYQNTLLHFACRHYLMDLLVYLLTHDINVNAKDENGNTALIIAVISNNCKTEMLELLLKIQSIDVNIINNRQKNALQLAIEYNNVAAIKLLIEHCQCQSKIIKINEQIFLETVSSKRIDIITLILPYVNNINAKLRLKHNEEDEEFQRVQSLHQYGVDGDSALHIAVHTRNNTILNLLLQNNIDVNLTNVDGKLTALHLALQKRLNQMIISLLNYGANCNLSSDFNTTLNYAIEYDNNTDIIKLIFSKMDKNNINVVNFRGESALYTAVKMNNEVIINLLLLQCNIDVNLATTTINRFTALHLALVRKLSDQIILSLLECGANCNLSSDTDTTLNYGIQYDNIIIIKLIISKLDNNNINMVNSRCESALHIAINKKNEIIINLLLQNNIDVNLVSTNNKCTALHLALDKKLNEQIIISLLECGADVNLSSDVDTTLNYGIAYGNTNIFKLILSKIDRNNINNVNAAGESALYTAIRLKNEIIINLLLQNNIDVNLVTTDKKVTALHLAFYYKLNEQIILSLIKRGANCNVSSDTDTILNYGIQYDNINMIKLIISKLDKSNINMINSRGESALHIAINSKNEIIINLLLQNNIDVNLVSTKNKCTALHLALDNKLSEQIIISLLECGADVNLSSDVDTTLNYGIKYGNINIFKLILSKIDRNNINNLNAAGESALYTAIRLKNEIIINLLLQNNIDVNLVTTNKKLTALHLALYNKLNEQIILSLIKHGANCYLSSADDTTLNYAIAYDNINIVKLIKSKLDKSYINMHNSRGESALHRAVYVGNTNVINFILNQKINLNLINSAGRTALQEACREYKRQPNYKCSCRQIDIIELMLPYHNTTINSSNGDNIMGSFYEVVQNYNKTQNSIYLYIIYLLLFEGHIIIDSKLLNYIKFMSKRVLQLFILSLVKRNQLIHDKHIKEFFFYNPNERQNPLILIENDICDYFILLENFNEIGKMRSRVISSSRTHKITYFQLVCMNRYQIATLFRTTTTANEYCKELKNYFKILNEFPKYSWLILNKYLNGKVLYFDDVVYPNI